MISISKLIDSVNQLAKNGTSGYTTEKEWNDAIYSLQYEVLSILCDNYENNQKVSDYLINHIRINEITANTNGHLEIDLYSSGSDLEDGGYYRTLSILLNGIYPATKVNINEVGMYLTSPIRKFDIAKNRVGYYFAEGDIMMLPKESMSVTHFYCKKPDLAKIAYTEVSDEDNDYLTVDELETIDIDFPEGLFNLFLYLLLEKLGIEMKEQLLTEYSQLGLSRTIKTDVS